MAGKKLSVILIVYNMGRAAPRSIRALTTPYQQGIETADYEILVIENGSSIPLDRGAIESLGPNVSYRFLKDAPPSPARAVNYGAGLALGEVLAVMIDGAHILTPGVLAHAMDMFAARPNPLVLTAPFFLGPGPQMETISNGYDEGMEDRLLARIGWPGNGYRLFEIGTPYRLIHDPDKRPKLFWFVRLFESNCLFMRKSSFDRIGGCDERFDPPGGGILLPDLYRRLADLEDAEVVQLIGEASFHQIHGGVSTNTSTENQLAQWKEYLAQYERVRGTPYAVSEKPIRYYGHMPNRPATMLMKTG